MQTYFFAVELPGVGCEVRWLGDLPPAAKWVRRLIVVLEMNSPRVEERFYLHTWQGTSRYSFATGRDYPQPRGGGTELT